MTVLDAIDLRIENGEKVGLIGRNGTGKSTIFRLMTGEIEADSGRIERMKRLRTACLAQLPEVEQDKTLHDIVLSHYQEFLDQEKRLESLEVRIGEGDESVLDEYGTLQEHFSVAGGYDFRSRIKRVLCGLGFLETEFSLPFHVLSGGQRTRLMLALVLLADADLLLLDEPENHLDLQAREWLESFLKDWTRALVIISHDRQMLNVVASRIIEVECGELRSFRGNFDAFIAEKERLRQSQESAYQKQQEYIEKEEKRINKFRYKKNKAKQAQSWIKKLDKLERVEAVKSEQGATSFGLGEVVRSGQLVLNAHDLSMGYENVPLYDGVSFTVERGERVGIIGPNGVGKTTLLKQLAGRHHGTSGTVELGPKVTMGYYDQQHEDLTSKLEVLIDFEKEFQQHSREALRSFLGRFLFTGDAVFKPLNTLSGGERSRLAIARLILQGANLLLLDEPTNHLDILSRAALEEALVQFNGTILMVSHDRHLIDRMVNKLIVVSNGAATCHLGNYSNYRGSITDNTVEETRDPDVLKIRKRRKINGKNGRAGQKDRNRLKRQLDSLESNIADIEEILESFDVRFQDVDPSDYTVLADLNSEKEGLSKDLQELYDSWEGLSSELQSTE
ncbi:MAG: ABC-F family ATP-binding cassette domain-containing protein [Candidatus Hydrogenedentota bacterium]